MVKPSEELTIRSESRGGGALCRHHIFFLKNSHVIPSSLAGEVASEGDKAVGVPQCSLGALQSVPMGQWPETNV